MFIVVDNDFNRANNKTIIGKTFDVAPSYTIVEEVRLFTEPNAKDAAQYLMTQINAPFVATQVSTLGGADRVTIMLKISLDMKSNWENGIFENSRFLHFRIEGKSCEVENFTRSHTISKKFRTRRCNTLADVIEKINEHLKNVR